MPGAEEVPEDTFELVGVLVHSGTAESGHYYSYIRERPSTGAKESWVEFNDETVSPWDPIHMEHHCFGGSDPPGPEGVLQYDRVYSAYMLFYQRSSVVAAQKQALIRSNFTSPIRLPVSAELSNLIAEDNELHMRKYCLYDPFHPTFARMLLCNIKTINKGRCSEDHNLEKVNLTVALNQVDQVLARAKDIPDFAAFMAPLKQMLNSCAECCRDFLEWIIECPQTLHWLILRNPELSVRVEIATLILKALRKVKAQASYAYGLASNDIDSGDEMADDDPRIIQRTVETIDMLWDSFQTTTRAWPEYFGLLENIAKLGDQEAALLLGARYLGKTLEIITADVNLTISPQIQKMLSVLAKRISTRPVSYEAIIGLLCSLLRVCDLKEHCAIDYESRVDMSRNDEPPRLLRHEMDLLHQHWTRGDNHILTDKLLQINQNEAETHNIIVLLLHGLGAEMDYCIYQAIMLRIKKPLPSVPSRPYLRAALVYCEHTESQRIYSVMTVVAKVASSLDGTEGKDFIQFFVHLLELDNNYNDIPKEDIFAAWLTQVPVFAPNLLIYYDQSVRQECEDLIRKKVLDHGPDIDMESSDIDVNQAEKMADTARDLGIECLRHLRQTYLIKRNQAVRAHLQMIFGIIDSCSLYYTDDFDDKTAAFKDLKSSKFLPSSIG